MNLKTWLPVFPGFYNTLFEPNLEYEIDAMRENDEIPNGVTDNQLYDCWDNGSYERAVVKNICRELPRHFPKDSGISECVFEEIRSPREYNFTNDSADVTFVVNADKFYPWIKGYLVEHSKEWTKHLRQHYQSRDGFCSSYTYDPEDWAASLDVIFEDVPDTGSIPHVHLIGRVLEFYLLNENDDFETTMYYDGAENLCLSEFFDLSKVVNRTQQ